MRLEPFCTCLFSILTIVGGSTLALAETASTTVEFPSAIHFLTPAGDDIEVSQGSYEVEAAESWLKLVPEGQGRMEAVLLDAVQGKHEEPLTEITVRLEEDPENQDVFHLVLLRSDGSGLEAMGTKSGIRPRGWKSAFVGKLRTAKTFRSHQRPSTPKRGSTSRLRRPKISLPGTGSQKLAPVSPVSKPIQSIHYRGNFPKHRNNGWGKGLQGVANDHLHWFFTQKGKLWKFPISHDLNTKVTKAVPSKGIGVVPIPKVLRAGLYNHFGDLDYFNGYLFIPLEGGGARGGTVGGLINKIPKISPVPVHKAVPRIAIFRSSNLAYVGSFLLPAQKKTGWNAIHPTTKQLYTSNSGISPADPLFVYAFDWEQFKTVRSGKPNSESGDHRSCTPGPRQVAFFKDPDYRGACSIRGVGSYAHSNNVGVKNDSISSIKVGRQAEVMVCHDANMGGYCETITKSNRYLSRRGRLASIGRKKKGLNDKISSAIVSPLFLWKGSPQRKILYDAQGQKKLTIKGYLQGGDFSAYGQELYIVNGKGHSFDSKDGGIWVFSGKNLRLMKRSSGRGEFKYEFHPKCCKFEEPEGITIWNVPKGRAPRIPGSQVHVILLATVNQWYFKHYEVIRSK